MLKNSVGMTKLKASTHLEHRDCKMDLSNSSRTSPLIMVCFGCSVENSEHLSDLLKDWKIPHNVLNARPKVL